MLLRDHYYSANKERIVEIKKVAHLVREREREREGETDIGVPVTAS